MLNSSAIKQHAAGLGFDLCGISAADAFPELQYLPQWLARGYAGEMRYMEKSAQTRADIRNFLPSARSVIVTGTIYNTERRGWDRSTALTAGRSTALTAGRSTSLTAGRSTSLTAGRSTSREHGSDTVRVARYARGQDYHVVLYERLETLLDWMREQHGDRFEAAIFCDKHHVQERVYAQHAGLGWIGKNSCVINPGIGSWILLAGIAISLEFPADAPVVDQCGSCTLCIDACPTGALVDARELDATKCISYLTIETSQIAEAQRPLIGQHIWGCDVCQDVCPFNLAPPLTSDVAWSGPIRDGLSAAHLWEQTDDEIHERIRGSAMTFVPLSRLRRNLAIVIGNSGNRSLADALDRPGHGKKNAARSASTPAVQDAVEWARRQLSD